MFQGFNSYYMNNIDRGGREILGVTSLKSYITTGNPNPYNARLRSSKGDSYTSRQVKKVAKNALTFAGAVATIAATAFGAVALIKGCQSGGKIRKFASSLLNSSKTGAKPASKITSKVTSKIKMPKFITNAAASVGKLFKNAPKP